MRVEIGHILRADFGGAAPLVVDCSVIIIIHMSITTLYLIEPMRSPICVHTWVCVCVQSSV